MISHPRISVIVPVLDRRDLLKRCLDSIGAQTWPDAEVIVVDNGSTDGTYELALHHRLRFPLKVVRELRPGAPAARNKGLEEATGEYIIFFDSDDVMHPRLMEKAMAALSGECMISCWKCRIHTLAGGKRIPPFHPDSALDNHLIHTLLRTQGFMAHRRLWLKAGGWNENLPCWNDLEAGLRVLHAASELSRLPIGEVKVCGVDEVLADIYQQRKSITGTSFSAREGMWERSLETMENYAMKIRDQARIDYILLYRRMILSAQYLREGNRAASRRLMDEVTGSGHLNRLQKTVMRLLGLYTAHGGRGAWHLASLLAPSH